MRYTRDICLMNAATLTATTTKYIVVPEGSYSAIGFIKVGTVSGTTPTLDFTIDRGVRLPTTSDTPGLDIAAGPADYSANYVWIPLYKATQITASTKIQPFDVSALGGSAFSAAQGATIPAPTLFPTAVGSLGAVWRVTFTIGGTNPSFGTVAAAVQFGGV